MEPLFIEPGRGPHGKRFALLHRAHGHQPRGLIVFAAPFAEEMNKSRRMVSLQSRALAAQGWTVLCPDLFGCGDSEGDFGEASWAQWVDDLITCSHWLRAHVAGQSSEAPLTFWGLRAGALLACEAARRLGDVAGLLLWQPQVAGAAVLQQFLRVASAGEMLASAARSGHAPSLRARLAAGNTIEVAGYRVAPELAAGLEQARLGDLPPAQRVDWFELSSRAESSLSPAATRTIEVWKSAGAEVRADVVQGPAFWQTSEIEDAPALLHATQSALQR